MVKLKLTASVSILVWLGTLAFLAGPARWEFAHTFAHWIEKAGDSLPLLTVVVGRPILGLGPSSLVSLFMGLVFWGFAWLGPVVVLAGIWRAHTREQVAEWLLFGGVLYGSVMLACSVVILVSFWLPFALL